MHAPHLAPGVNDVSLKPWGYGYLWWIPSTPMGGDYFASGIYNQYVYVNPEHRVVIANTAANERYPEAPEGYKLAFVDLFQAITRSLAA